MLTRGIFADLPFVRLSALCASESQLSTAPEQSARADQGGAPGAFFAPDLGSCLYQQVARKEGMTGGEAPDHNNCQQLVVGRPPRPSLGQEPAPEHAQQHAGSVREWLDARGTGGGVQGGGETASEAEGGRKPGRASMGQRVFASSDFLAL